MHSVCCRDFTLSDLAYSSYDRSMNYFKIRRHLFVFAMLVMAGRLLFMPQLPAAASASDCHQFTSSLRQSSTKLLEIVRDSTPYIAADLKPKVELPKTTELGANPPVYRLQDCSKNRYCDGMIRYFSYLRAPPRPLWLINCSLLC